MSRLIVVDGPNLYNDVARFFAGLKLNADDKHLGGQYLQDFFDIDRLVEATLQGPLSPWSDLGIVVFHSNKALGDRTSPGRMDGEQSPAFWARQGANPNSSTHLVAIEGSPSGAEKGIDTSIVVHLYETLNRWDTAVLFTNDSDFVPVVWALRKQGKRVFCSAPISEGKTPLVQASQHFFAWDELFLMTDFQLYKMLHSTSDVSRFLKTKQAKYANLHPEKGFMAFALPPRSDVEELKELVKTYGFVAQTIQDPGPLRMVRIIHSASHLQIPLAGADRHLV